jgi:NDP-sugar pyrophosphorylase family protein
MRGELKNTVLLDKANFPHPSYVGDSVCGFMSHFGNQATAANLGIFEGLREGDERKNIVVKAGGKSYDLGKPKMGICLGDFSQVGCNSVSDPGTFLGPKTIVYSLTRITKGFYGPNEILKNKPMEHGVVERAEFKE